MPTQPKALLLADELEDMTCLWSPSVNRARVDKAAAELRRLHELLEAEQTLHQRVIYPELQRLRTQRDALLEALRSIADCCDEEHAARDYASRQAEIRGIARAAIAKTEGQK